MSFFGTLFRDKNGKIAVLQLPNVWLVTWAIAAVATHMLHNSCSRAAGYVATVAIIIWAGLEIATGDSLLRRILGVLVLTVVLYNRF